MINKLFFALVRSGLWGTTAETTMFEGVDHKQWQELYDMARVGSTIALVYDGVSKLPNELQPPRDIRLKWFSHVEHIHQHNRLCMEVLEEVAECFNENGVEFILLKGLAIANIYLDPLSRDGGDIDLLITKGYERANELMTGKGGRILEDNIKHRSFHYKGVTVENHHQLAMTPNINTIITSLITDNTVLMNGISIPNRTANSVYLTSHIAAHFFVSGIGLRHLCDLCRLFAMGGIDMEVCRRDVKATGAKALLSRLEVMMVNDLGVERSSLPFEPIDDSIAKRVLNDVLVGGNFGNFNASSRSSNRWIHKSQTMIRMAGRTVSYISIGGATYAQSINELIRFNVAKLLGQR